MIKVWSGVQQLCAIPSSGSLCRQMMLWLLCTPTCLTLHAISEDVRTSACLQWPSLRYCVTRYRVDNRMIQRKAQEAAARTARLEAKAAKARRCSCNNLSWHPSSLQAHFSITNPTYIVCTLKHAQFMSSLPIDPSTTTAILVVCPPEHHHGPCCICTSARHPSIQSHHCLVS